MRGNTRLATDSLAEEIERRRAEPAEGGIAIGGAALAAEAAAPGLIDEYRTRGHRSGRRWILFFPHRERRVELELVQTRTFTSGSSSSAIA